MSGLICMFFFFQAEDGIRDRLVTGVQTCALPIYELVINLPLTQDLMGDNSNIIIGYQGCADAGLCYPPQKRSIQVGD